MQSCLLAFTHLLIWTLPLFAAEEEARAGRMVTIRESGDITRIYVGDVEMSFGGLEVRADSARARTNDNRILFRGGVHLSDGDRAISADTLDYDRELETASFHGSAVVRRGSRLLSADRITYRRATGSLYTAGGVRLDDPVAGLFLRADVLLFHTAGDSGRAAGSTVTVKTRESSSDTVRAAADTVSFRNSGNEIRFGGRVRVERAGVQAAADVADYRAIDSTLDLFGGVRAAWMDEGTEDSVRATALRLRTAPRQEGGQALALSGEVALDLGHEPTTRRASGDSIQAYLEGGRLASAIILGRATITLHTRSGEATSMTADTIAIGFEEGALDSIGMSGSGVVNHASVGQAARSRVSGDRVVVLLHASEIHRVRATGHAACAHAISGKESEAATLTGDSVWAEFERGKLQHTRADGGVRGRYGSEGASSK